MHTSMISTQALTRHVLVLAGPDGRATADLARRLREIGAPNTTVESIEEAQQLQREARLDIGALLIPTRFETGFLKKSLGELVSNASANGIRFVSVGDPPSKSERRKLRKLGIRLALWNPLCEGFLRFQINRALFADPKGFDPRGRPRVPTEHVCSIRVDEREKQALIYSLAANGAFLATPRASMVGARLDLELRLAGGSIFAKASVVFANVPGNLQRPGLPMGMGVRFEPLARCDQQRVAKFIVERTAQLEV